MTLPTGTKRTSGLVVILLPFIAQMMGYNVSEAFPVEMGLIVDKIFAVIGAILVIYGEVMAQGPAWFVPKAKREARIN